MGGGGCGWCLLLQAFSTKKNTQLLPAVPCCAQTYKKLPEIVRRWHLFREEALRAGDGRQLLLGRPPVGCDVTWIRREVVQIMQVGCLAGKCS